MKLSLFERLFTASVVVSASFVSSLACGSYDNLINKYVYVKDLGGGKQGSVELYKHKNSEKCVAIKKISKSDEHTCDSEKLAFECKEMLSESPYFSKPIEYFEDDHYFYFVYEYIDGFSVYSSNKLKDYVKELENVDLFMCTISLQFMNAFKYLYENRLSYGDLTYENIILIDDKNTDVPAIKINVPTIKIIDYGFFSKNPTPIDENGWGRLCDILEKMCEDILEEFGISYDESFDTPNLLKFIRKLSGACYWCKKASSPEEFKEFKNAHTKPFKTFEEAIELLKQSIGEN